MATSSSSGRGRSTPRRRTGARPARQARATRSRHRLLLDVPRRWHPPPGEDSTATRYAVGERCDRSLRVGAAEAITLGRAQRKGRVRDVSAACVGGAVRGGVLPLQRHCGRLRVPRPRGGKAGRRGAAAAAARPLPRDGGAGGAAGGVRARPRAKQPVGGGLSRRVVAAVRRADDAARLGGSGKRGEGAAGRGFVCAGAGERSSESERTPGERCLTHDSGREGGTRACVSRTSGRAPSRPRAPPAYPVIGPATLSRSSKVAPPYAFL